jgi:hypothetical protein
MAQSHLRIYHGPDAQFASVANHREQPRTISLSLDEILPLLTDAVRSERTWLRDFADDEITISTDLYEVILAYQHCRRPSA